MLNFGLRRVNAAPRFTSLELSWSANHDDRPASIMTSIDSVTRKIAALELSSKQNTSGTGAPSLASKPSRQGHQKAASQSKVAALLTKLAPPAPFPESKSTGALGANTKGAGSTSSLASTAKTPKSTTKVAPQDFDIGRYDDGFEKDNEKRGSVVTGEAAKVLALDSSVCGCVHYHRLYVVAER